MNAAMFPILNAHMPFIDLGGCMVYCSGSTREGPVGSYRAWRPRYLEAIRPYVPLVRPVDGPLACACNPVCDGDAGTFIQSNILYAWTPNSVAPIATGVVTGYRWRGELVTIVGAEISHGGDAAPPHPFKRILRAVPAVDRGCMLVTGSTGDAIVTGLWVDGGWSRVTVGGRDVYKCCQLNGGLVHATIRPGGVEERSLEYAPEYELSPFDNLQPTSCALPIQPDT